MMKGIEDPFIAFRCNVYSSDQYTSFIFNFLCSCPMMRGESSKRSITSSEIVAVRTMC